MPDDALDAITYALGYTGPVKAGGWDGASPTVEIGPVSARQAGKLATLRRLAREYSETTGSTPHCDACQQPVAISTAPASRHLADEHTDPQTGATCPGGAVWWPKSEPAIEQTSD